MNILLTISYDGTNYCGFQKQPNCKTIQGELEKALKKLYKKDLSTILASRTDSSVHAIGQHALYSVESSIPLKNIPNAINTYLPDDIVVTNAIEKNEGFHPRFSAKSKIYTYKILNADFPDPLLRNYTCFFRRKLDIEKMILATEKFIGTHDFKAFSATGGNVKTSIRTIYSISIKKTDDIIIITFFGNSFLYNMIRIIVGTLLDVGIGKTLYSDIDSIILSKNRKKAGRTAPPNGLTLVEIKY